MVSNLIRALVANPRSAFTAIQARKFPATLWRRYAEKCAASGFGERSFVLSFDCDTPEDIKVALDVHHRLLDMNILAVYAVPGELLRIGDKVYTAIAETGAEFMNHGDISHTYFDERKQRYASCFFYHEQTHERLKRDICEGDKTVTEIIGVKPKGFRTPHFGTFQAAADFKFLYEILTQLEYDYSSSATPEKGLRFGPVYQQDSLLELPVTGMASNPMNILDSWAFFEAPDRQFSPKDYLRECENLKDLSVESQNMFLNIYADPSHIADSEEFFEAMAIIRSVMPSKSYKEVVARARV